MLIHLLFYATIRYPGIKIFTWGRGWWSWLLSCPPLPHVAPWVLVGVRGVLAAFVSIISLGSMHFFMQRNKK